MGCKLESIAMVHILMQYNNLNLCAWGIIMNEKAITHSKNIN
jgi:hypothetical protein